MMKRRLLRRTTENQGVFQGNSMELIGYLRHSSVQVVVTSPPYYGQRRSGHQFNWLTDNPMCNHYWEATELPYTKMARVGSTETEKHTKLVAENRRPDTAKKCRHCGQWYGELGHEESVWGYVGHLTGLFNRVHRVLRDDGVLWVNIGDVYLAGPQDCSGKGSLLGVPERFVISMQDEGWVRRQTVIWRKPNVKTDGAKSRPTTEHEYVYMFTKAGAGYEYDHMRSPVIGKTTGQPRNIRSVWEFPVGQGEQHTSTFPVELARRCIRLSTPDHVMMRVAEPIVFDPFTGEGSTGVAAVEEGCVFVGFEAGGDSVAIARRKIGEARRGSSH